MSLAAVGSRSICRWSATRVIGSAAHWTNSGKRVDEVEKLVEQASGVYYAIQVTGQNYSETDQDSQAEMNKISANDVTRYCDDADKPYGHMESDKDDHGSSIAAQFTGREGSDGEGGDGGGADEED